MSEPMAVIEELRAEGKLKALPITHVNKEKSTLCSKEGMELREYRVSGTWVTTGELSNGTIRYLGSASHAGHIELKALYVLLDDQWHNIVSGAVEPHEGFD